LRILKFFVLSFSLIVISCATKRPTGSTEAEVLFKEAKDLISKSRYIQATEKLNSIRSQYPYSFYATHAELLQADILFSQENYAEAASAYILFRDFHPKYTELGYVIFRISESFYRQLPSTYDRDLSAGIEESIKLKKW
jgi:outer membrane protein assembly factor BamD